VEERAKFLRILVVGIMLTASAAWIALADPMGPSGLERYGSQRGITERSSKSAPAEAGNVTELMINATTITKTWQGYYGNVSGKIVLDDANNMSMYNWALASVDGEIYASNSSTVSWSNVNCFNLTAYGDGTAADRSGNLTYYELYLGVPSTAADGVDETFNTASHSAFSVGTRSFSADTCPSVKTYVNNAPQTSTSDFIELMMYDNSTRVAVFTTLINNTVTGFNNKKWDFQMMVPVKGGHDAPATIDTFYFFAEIE